MQLALFQVQKYSSTSFIECRKFKNVIFQMQTIALPRQLRRGIHEQY